MKNLLLKMCTVVTIATCALSCSHHKGDGSYFIVNNTEDTIFYGHSYVYHGNSIQTQQTIRVEVVDTITPQESFLFAFVEKDQNFHLDAIGMAAALSEPYAKIPLDKESCYLKYKGKAYYIDVTNDKNSFFYPQNYINSTVNSTYHFYLKDYLDILQY